MDATDREWLERELDLVNEELARRFPSVPSARVSAAVEAAAAEFVASARVRHFLPILIRRRAQHHLSGVAPGSGPGRHRLAR